MTLFLFFLQRNWSYICVDTMHTQTHRDVNACFEMLAMLWKIVQQILICDFLGGKKKRKKDSDLKKVKNLQCLNIYNKNVGIHYCDF